MFSLAEGVCVWGAVEPVSLSLGGTIKPIADPVITKLDAFTRLPDGWDYGRGGPISRTTVETAKTWYVTLRKLAFSYVNAFPSPGAVTLAAGVGDYRVELIFREGNGAIRFGFVQDFKRRRQVYKPNLSGLGLLKAMQDALAIMAMGGAWSASTLYTPSNMTVTAGHSYQQRSSIMGTLSPLSALNAQAMTQSQGPFARTPMNIAEGGAGSSAAHLYFYESQRQKLYIHEAA